MATRNKNDKKKQPRTKKGPQGQDPGAPPPSQGDDFDAHLPAAMALPAEVVRPLRNDPGLAFQNVTLGLAAVVAVGPALRQALPLLDWPSIDRLPSLASALVFAANQVVRRRPPNEVLQALLVRARKVRRLLLTAAASSAEAGLLPAAQVAHIRTGSGPRDTANDCAQLARLFRDHASALAGKTAVTAADIEEADALGRQLLPLLQHGRARKAPQPSGTLAQQIDQRDRMFTLLAHAHHELRRAGAYHWVEEVDAQVPPLFSYDAPARRKPTDAPPPASTGPAPSA